MDTLYFRFHEEKNYNARFFLSGMLGMLLLSFNLTVRSAENIAYSVIPIPEITPKDFQTVNVNRQIEEFNTRIKNKYPEGTVTDLAIGVKRIKVVRYFNSRPVRLNIIETDFSINKDLAIKPVVAGENLNKKSKIRQMNDRGGGIVSVNGGYFKPTTGVPLGLLMVDGRVYTGQIYDRVAMGIFDDGYKMGRARVDIKLSTNKRVLNIDNINQPRMLASNVLVYDNLWGEKSPTPPKGGLAFSVCEGKILEVSKSALVIPKNGFVISAPYSKIKGLLKDKRLKLTILPPSDWKDVKHIISGGPYLVKDGEIFIDVTSQKLNSITGKNPRTAIGYTKEGNIILITADGREKASVGLTLGELARYMQQIGCVNAMNLDGGSSTVMFGGGQVLNSPATIEGIPVSNAVTLYEND